MTIRKLRQDDIQEAVTLWYDTSLVAHHFIAPEFWERNKPLMASAYLPNAEVYLAIDHDEMIGFVAMVENYLAAIFVKTAQQGKGAGKLLLEHVKCSRQLIELKVYQKNGKSVQFYLKQGFEIVAECTEEETGEAEYFMRWGR